MKKLQILFTIVSILSFQLVSAQSTYRSNAGGCLDGCNWTIATTWQDLVQGAPSSSTSNDSIFITNPGESETPATSHTPTQVMASDQYVYHDGDLIIGSGTTLIIEGVLLVNGNFSVDGATVNIGANGALVVTESIQVNNLGEVNNSNYIVAYGDIIVSQQGNVNIDNTSGSIVTFGTYTDSKAGPQSNTDNTGGNIYAENVNSTGGDIEGNSPKNTSSIEGDDSELYNLILEANEKTGNSVLPVELIFMSAQPNSEGGVHLTWATASEVNNDYFEIQRSTDGKHFTSIGFVEGNGTAQQRIDYSYFDAETLNGNLFYRLKQVDYNGAFEYFHLVVNHTQPEKWNIKALANNTSTQGHLKIQLYSPDTQDMQISLMNINGTVLYHQTISAQQGQSLFTIPHNKFSKGIMVLTVYSKDQKKSIKIIR
ncbi:hypothetical protein V6R21_24265 [Limibacter armeniacum]|uniref:hypothetical protein n=1 Tax=Limibacter armeniacum TaxID=466084 RepID=UPI002FE60424